MNNSTVRIDQPQAITISVDTKAFEANQREAAKRTAEFGKMLARIKEKEKKRQPKPTRTADIVQAQRGGRTVGRNEPCPWHPLHKFKRCPHDCYRNGPPSSFSEPEQPHTGTSTSHGK